MRRPSPERLYDPARLAAVGRVNAFAWRASVVCDRLAGGAATALDVPVALVNLVDDERQRFIGCVGLDEPYASGRRAPIDWGYCPVVVTLGKPQLLGDVRIDPQYAGNRVCTELGFLAYAGVPLEDADGQTMGTLCILDRRPRRWTDRDRPRPGAAGSAHGIGDDRGGARV